MEKIAIIADSACDLRKETIEKLNINVLPFRIIYANREFRDGVEISADEVYESLKTEIPTTSLPSMQDIHDLFERLIDEGYTHVISISLSSGLSGVYNAVKLVSSEYEDRLTCHVYDTKTISLGVGYIIEVAGKMIQQGESFQNIIAKLPELREKVKLFLSFGTLEYLIRGGRIGKVSGTIGELLNLKPIVSVADDGKYFTYAKVRGKKQSMKKMVEIAKGFMDKNCKICIMDGQARAEAEKLYSVLKDYSDKFNRGCVELLGNISPVSGVHSGPGFIGMAAIDLTL